MAVRTPLKLVSSEPQAMTSVEITAIIDQCMYLYAANPTVNISVSTTGGTLGTVADTRFISGTASTSTTAFPDESVTGEPTITTVNYARMTESTTGGTTEPADTGNIAFPLYYDNGLKAMSVTDMYDTFINPAIAKLADGADRPGTYRIHSATTLANHTLISTTPVFVDTKAGINDMTAAEIGTAGTTQDDSVVVTNYYLFRTDQGSVITYPTPLFVRSDGDLQEYLISNFESTLQSFVRHAAVNNASGNRLRYNLNGAGNNKGTGMIDTRITSTTGTYTTYYVNTDDYRAQEFPAGTAVAQTTTFLRATTS